MVSKGNHPQMALIQLVKYYNLPRLIEGFEETPLTTGFYDDR